MNKYDFGYELHPDSTIEWAYHQIMPNSVILELGPSNGNLIYHLVKYKNCIADIVEIDSEAGEQASKYARNSCIGPVNGNIEREEWFEKLSGTQYDYIVILDVLEHIRNPKDVLLCVRQLLKNDGRILLSVPNIAHNSILINLLQNKFQYTPVGLLDDTHIHFYTYESAKQLLQNAGLSTVKEEVKQKNVGENEVEAYYGMLPKNVEAYLKTRPLGTAYQYLFTIQKGISQADVKLEYVPDKNYEFVVFDGNDVLSRIPINPSHKMQQSIELTKSAQALRIDPLNQNCVIADLVVCGYSSNGNLVQLIDCQHTGGTLGEKIVFYDNDPQIYLRWEKDISRLVISFEFVCFDDKGLCALVDQQRFLKNLEDTCKELKKKNEELEKEHNALITYLSEHKTKSIIKILGNKGFERK